MKYIVFNYIDKKIVRDNLTEKDLEEVYKTIDFNVEFVYRYVESDGNVSFVDWLIAWSNAVESNDTRKLDYLRNEYPEFFNSHYEAVFQRIMIYGIGKTEENMGIRIGETGLNPTIPLCPVCNKPKNEVAITGLAGEEWAKKNGYSDGKMPMYTHIDGDIVPCDECKKQGITIIEATHLHGYTGRLFLVKEEFIKKVVKSQEMINKILEERICYMEPEVLKMFGFPPFQKAN